MLDGQSEAESHSTGSPLVVGFGLEVVVFGWEVGAGVIVVVGGGGGIVEEWRMQRGGAKCHGPRNG